MTSKSENQTEVSKALRKKVGTFLQRLRQAHELTQNDVANHLGYQYFTFVAQIEQGRSRIPPGDWNAWADLYGQDRREFARRLLKHYDPHVYSACFEIEKER